MGAYDAYLRPVILSFEWLHKVRGLGNQILQPKENEGDPAYPQSPGGRYRAEGTRERRFLGKFTQEVFSNQFPGIPGLILFRQIEIL